MQHLDLYDVLAVVARVMQCDPDAAIRRTDLDAVAQVLSEATSPLCQDDLAEAGGVLLSGLVSRRPFAGPNRTIAVAVVLQLAGLNDADLELEPVEELDALLDRVSSGQAPIAEVIAEVIDVVRHRLQCRELTLSSLGSEDQINPEESDMFEKFTERARRVMVLAQEEARNLQHNYIGTEHVLLAILEEGGGTAAKVLANLNISTAAARAVVLEIVGRGEKAPAGHIPFTPRSKRVLEYSLREAVQLGHQNIGTEHILLGIVQDGEGVAAQTLVKLGVDLSKVRQLIRHRQHSEAAVTEFLAGDSGSFTPKMPARKHHLLSELESLIDENDNLYEQVRRLREKLRQHNIDPDD
ncbi:ClpA/ClpB-like protein [Kribbella voronezhensis]|uniref:ClpA/ClpB-like protein n=1 Tax=Kribbella voronezhensis TaxID=2512212 RepID=A0A4R7SYW2_9ACTN|nr:ClpA/ClpB-like protein [Kribbella voronezhensis]